MFKWLSNYRAACSIYMGTLSLTLFINHPTSAKQAEPSESVHEKLSVELLLAGLFFSSDKGSNWEWEMLLIRHDTINYVYVLCQQNNVFISISGYMAVSTCASSVNYNNTYIQNPG